MWGDRLELIICFGRVTFSTAFRPKSFGKRLVSEQIYTKAINNSVILLIDQMRKFSCFSIPIFGWFFNCKKRNTSKIQLKYHPKIRTEKDKFQSKGRNRALSEVHKISGSKRFGPKAAKKILSSRLPELKNPTEIARSDPKHFFPKWWKIFWLSYQCSIEFSFLLSYSSLSTDKRIHGVTIFQEQDHQVNNFPNEMQNARWNREWLSFGHSIKEEWSSQWIWGRTRLSKQRHLVDDISPL